MVPLFVVQALGFSLIPGVLFEAAGSPGIDSGMSFEAVRLTVLATVLCIWAFFNTIGAQIKLKSAAGDENATHVGLRCMMNDLEQLPFFLVLLWLHCAYVDSMEAGQLGLIYAFYVFIYQLAYSYYGHFTILVEVSTQPRYLILTYFGFSLTAKCLGFPLLHSLIAPRVLEAGFFGQSDVAQQTMKFSILFIWPIFNHFFTFAFPTAALSVQWNVKANPAVKRD